MLSILLLSLLVVAVPHSVIAQTSSTNTSAVNSYNMTQQQPSIYAPSPSIVFPSIDQVKQLSEQRGYKNMPLATMANESISSIRATADVNNTLFIVWISGTNHVWLSKSNTPEYGGNYSYYQRVYTTPIELTPPGSANVTNLSIASNNQVITVVWQFFNKTTGKYNIFGAQSEDSGSTWDAHLLSPANVNSINPVLATAGFVYWEGENESACGDPWQPHDQDHGAEGTLTNSNATNLETHHRPISVCMHGW
jgi:hypothetical protein